jgi:hypothetical protein
MPITVTDARMRHILDGDATGGGHRHGAGDPVKSKFPATWSDAKIKSALLSIANDASLITSVQPNGRARKEGVRDGIRIRVIYDPAGCHRASLLKASLTEPPRCAIIPHVGGAHGRVQVLPGHRVSVRPVIG